VYACGEPQAVPVPVQGPAGVTVDSSRCEFIKVRERVCLYAACAHLNNPQGRCSGSLSLCSRTWQVAGCALPHGQHSRRFGIQWASRCTRRNVKHVPESNVVGCCGRNTLRAVCVCMCMCCRVWQGLWLLACLVQQWRLSRRATCHCPVTGCP
jgi:hypothetical protein